MLGLVEAILLVIYYSLMERGLGLILGCVRIISFKQPVKCMIDKSLARHLLVM
jgi:hypothetical protein